MTSLQTTFLSLLRNMTHVMTQNKLMACTDREIAVAMLHMDDVDREYVFSFLARSKEERIKEEIRLLKKTRITKEHYRKILLKLIKQIKGEGSGPQSRSYFKPRK